MRASSELGWPIGREAGGPLGERHCPSVTHRCDGLAPVPELMPVVSVMAFWTMEGGPVLASEAGGHDVARRNVLYAWLLPSVIVAVVVGTAWSLVAGLALFLVGMALAVRASRGTQPAGLAIGGVGMRNSCEECGAALQNRLGAPGDTCPSCGHRQSWAK